MRSGPSTILPVTSLETVAKILQDGSVGSSVVTDPEGRLIGTLYLEHADLKFACRKTSLSLQIGNYGAHRQVKRRKGM